MRGMDDNRLHLVKLRRIYLCSRERWTIFRTKSVPSERRQEGRSSLLTSMHQVAAVIETVSRLLRRMATASMFSVHRLAIARRVNLIGDMACISKTVRFSRNLSRSKLPVDRLPLQWY